MKQEEKKATGGGLGSVCPEDGGGGRTAAEDGALCITTPTLLKSKPHKLGSLSRLLHRTWNNAWREELLSKSIRCQRKKKMKPDPHRKISEIPSLWINEDKYSGFSLSTLGDIQLYNADI